MERRPWVTRISTYGGMELSADVKILLSKNKKREPTFHASGGKRPSCVPSIEETVNHILQPEKY